MDAPLVAHMGAAEELLDAAIAVVAAARAAAVAIAAAVRVVAAVVAVETKRRTVDVLLVVDALKEAHASAGRGAIYVVEGSDQP